MFKVLQGLIRGDGTGDVDYICGEFQTYEEAVECFNGVKDDSSDWVGKGYLVTWIVDGEWNILQSEQIQVI